MIASGGKSSYEVSKELRADFVLNYREENVVQRVMQLTNHEGVDLIYDCIGGETLARSIQAIKKGPYVGSRLVTIAAGPLEINFGYEIHCLYVRENRRDLSLIANLIERGLLKPVIDSVFCFRDIPSAQQKLEKGGISGKVVVSMEKD